MRVLLIEPRLGASEGEEDNNKKREQDKPALIAVEESRTSVNDWRRPLSVVEFTGRPRGEPHSFNRSSETILCFKSRADADLYKRPVDVLRGQ